MFRIRSFLVVLLRGSRAHRLMAGRPHLHALTGLRFCAAAHVWFYHCLPAAWVAGVPGALGLLGSGTASVSLFFVLSGFVLAYAYLRVDAAEDGGWRVRSRRGDSLRLGRYAINRVARIYPVYALSIAVALPYPLLAVYRDVGGDVVAIAEWAAGLVPMVLLVHAWTPELSDGINMVAWSLSVEAFFYLTFPWLAASSRMRMALTRPGWLLAGLGALSIVPVLLVVGGVVPGGDAAVRFVNRFPLLRWPEFLIGVVLGVLYLRAHQDEAADRPSARRGERGGLGRALLRGRFGLVGWAGAAVVVGLGATADWPPTLVRALALPLFCLLIWGLATARTWGSRLLATRPLRVLGEASYALYILHVPLFLVWLSVTTRTTGWGTSSPWFLVTYFAFTLAVSIGVLRAVENPARRWIRRWGAKRPATPASKTPAGP
jgi:peptidoglycan/LPS O-acetylase OafA/YrhL